MDWDKLRIFHNVAEAGNLTRAGKSLQLSQSVVSRHVSALEQDLGVPLFRRHARGLVLTEQGEILHEATAHIYEQLARIEGKIADSRDLAEGPLVITVSEFIGTTWLAPKLSSFKKKHQKIKLSVLFDDRILNLNMKEADAAIRLFEPTEPDLIQLYLTSIDFHACASRQYLKKHGRPQKPADLKDHALIGFTENVPAPYVSTNVIFEWADLSPREHENTLMMNSMYALQKTTAMGAGISLLPDYLIHDNKDLEVILPNLESPSLDMYFVYAEERKHSKRINAFKDFLTENIEKTTFSVTA